MAQNSAVAGFQSLPIVKQLGLLIGLSLSVALGFYLVLWSKSPDFVPLSSSNEIQDTSKIVDALDRSGILYKIDDHSGVVMVPSNKKMEAKLKLAQSGVSVLSGTGFELLDKETGLGSSQFIEATRYNRALQGELERTISAISTVKSARVHLAVPKQSSFIRNKQPASASVLVNLYPGHQLQSDQISAIVQLVASSVQGLTPQQVSVVDQNGHLLSSQGEDGLAKATQQINFTRNIEKTYSDRIYQLLSPIVGEGRIKTEVTAVVDYTSVEETAENYNKEAPVVRSEKTLNIEKGGEIPIQGIPGALSNTPATAGGQPKESPKNAPKQSDDKSKTDTKVSSNQSSQQQVSRNYEIDRKISYTQHIPGKLIKLSAAVIVDDKLSFNKQGKATKAPYTPEELTKLTNLAKEAIGFDETRGDKIQVLNQSFAQAEPIEELKPLPIYEQDWFYPVIKQIAAGLIILIIIFIVLRPILKNLSKISADQQLLAKQINQMQYELPPGREFDAIKGMVADDPKKVAQVVKNWVGTE
jgi:flagellar M-ring protein FliF